MTAYHESGHALLAWLVPGIDRLHKVSIVPRGRSLGATQLLPEEDRLNISESELQTRLLFLLGGRAAEKLVFDEYSAGAEDDLNKATQLARRMVTHWGMSERLGPVAFRDSEDHPFLGREMAEPRRFSEHTAQVIDEEVSRLLRDASDKATAMLTAAPREARHAGQEARRDRDARRGGDREADRPARHKQTAAAATSNYRQSAAFFSVGIDSSRHCIPSPAFHSFSNNISVARMFFVSSIASFASSFSGRFARISQEHGGAAEKAEFVGGPRPLGTDGARSSSSTNNMCVLGGVTPRWISSAFISFSTPVGNGSRRRRSWAISVPASHGRRR